MTRRTVKHDDIERRMGCLATYDPSYTNFYNKDGALWLRLVLTGDRNHKAPDMATVTPPGGPFLTKTRAIYQLLTCRETALQ